jgi:hypothetical protein
MEWWREFDCAGGAIVFVGAQLEIYATPPFEGNKKGAALRAAPVNDWYAAFVA